MKSCHMVHQKHCSPLHKIIHVYDLKPHQMERIDAVVLGHKWQPAYTTCITSNKEQAINEVETNDADVKVFTDGSCRDGHVGAAAVLYRGGTEKQVVKLYMGTEDEHNVFEAEQAAAAIGAKLLNVRRGTRFTIVLDNQAAIKTTRREKNDIRAISGQCTAPTSGRHHKIFTRQKHYPMVGSRA